MNHLRGRRFWIIATFLGYALLALGLSVARSATASRSGPSAGDAAASQAPAAIAAFGEPTYSSPIALSADKKQLWVVNPDEDTVSAFDVSSPNPANYRQIAKIRVGDEPQGIALDTISATTYNAYVANAAGNSVSIIRVNTSSAFSALFEKTVTTGAEPWNVVASPDGKRVFVANSGQDTITVIDTATRTILGSVDVRNSACNDPDRQRHFQPRGLAVTLNNTRLYVTRFLSFTRAGGKQADDNGKEGVVCRFTLNTGGATAADVLRQPVQLKLAARPTGFNDANTVATSAYPNQLQSIVIRDNNNNPAAYVPNIAASPSGPLKFNVDTQAFVNRIANLGAIESDAGALNLHLGAKNPEPTKTKLFFANPWAIAFTSQSGAGSAYVVSAGSDLLVKLNVDAAGVLAFTGGADRTRYIDLHDPTNAATSGANAGKNPLGIVIRNSGAGNRFAYVMNYISRNISIVNLDTDSVARVLKTGDLPFAGTQDEQLHVGKEIFFASRGVFDGGKVNRLSSEGWQNCASCHFAGLTDGNIWSFNAGPRKAVPLNATWSPHNPDDQRLLNYSAIFDEVQDFEANIRNVSGPGNLPNTNPPQLDPNHGLLIGDAGDINKAPGAVNAFAKPNEGRPQLTVTLPGSTTAWPALDAMKEWVRFAVRTPNSPLSTDQLGAGAPGALDAAAVRNGRRLFFRAGCAGCHGGTKWTISSKDFNSPPAGTEIFCEVDLRAGTPPVANPPPGCQKAPVNANPVAVQFLDRFLRNVGSFGFNSAGIGAVEKSTDNKDALGKDHNQDGRGNGYNVPSLLGIWGLPPYYHNGGCETLACVLADPNHRAAGRPILSPADQVQVAVFLQSLDAQTAFPTNLYINKHDIFFDPPKVFRGSTTQLVGVNISLFGTTADLADLLNGGALNVRFSGPGLSADVPITAAHFNEDFGQATVSVPWTVPNNTGFAEIVVRVDSGNVVPEDKENDNVDRRRVFVNALSADSRAPFVTPGSVRISDDNPFDVNDPIVTTRNVKVRFQATDTGGSGLKSFCIVRYSYNTRLRRWIEENCDFKPLTQPDPGTSNTFTVDAQLPERPGAAYVFVWVQDRAGNISRRPELDVVSFIPFNQNISIERNDARVFRVLLNAGQTASFTFTPTTGDVDVVVFQNGNLLATNPKSGTQAESVTISSTANNTVFQIEVRAVVNSVFRISGTSDPAASGLEVPAIAPAIVGGPPRPLVTARPAAQTAIEAIPGLNLPLIVR